MKPFVGILVLLMAVTSAFGQKPFKPNKYKAPHQGQQKAKKAPAPVIKQPKAAQNSAAADLRRAETEGAKAHGVKHVPKEKAPKVVKVQKDKAQPQIRVAVKGGHEGALTNQGANPYKGRLKQKGAHHR